MIPDFKTYLKESVWMDIHKHSTGDGERKEESVNCMNYDGFCEYLCTHYGCYDGLKIYKYDPSKRISIPLFKSDVDGEYKILLMFDEELKVCFMSSDRNKKREMEFFEELGKIYDIRREQQVDTYIYKRGGMPFTNSDVLELIDYILKIVPNDCDSSLYKIKKS